MNIKLKKNKLITNIIGIILDVLIFIFSIIIILGIYYIFQIKILKNEYANMFGYSFFEVATGSMSPTIEIGDVVIVKITKEVNEDDIIVYRENENFITHRLIEKKEDKLIAKGDANNSEDKPIELEDVLGKVEKIIPKVGIWRKAILQPEIIGLTITVIVIFSITFVYTITEDKE